MQNLSKSVKLTSKNQLTVPAQVTRALGLKSGDFLQYELKAGTLILKPRPNMMNRLEAMWQANAATNKGTASDSSIKQTLRTFHTQLRKP